ncbi:MAG: hypothetical protein GOVbin707_14 [Prokaryotic dsDNA virus sp.]|jgi:hypothetical protein|nr:MAG: hypothetical protein GOVbin707_14 [Prokaryotic dsDNA virus sp.]|tara:strand:- start:5057 stop:5314 length:258 start_codon:yes stop_codon:yes gene_type:complete
MNEGKLREDRANGQKAELLLKNEILINAFVELEKQYLEIIKNSEIADVEVRENAYKLMRSLQLLQRHLETVVSTGKIALHQLDEG